MSISAIVYSRPGCIRCHVTHRQLKKMRIPVEKVEIDDYPEKITLMKDRGWMELPLVEATIDGEPHYWAGMSTGDLQAIEYLRNLGGGGDAA